MENKKGMFQSTCACGCGEPVWVYAKDKMGTLPKAYINKVHEGNDKNKKRFK
jgi:hypothetical protein